MNVLIVFTFAIFLPPIPVTSIEFDQNYIRIHFSPYVKSNSEDQPTNSCLHNYTVNELKTMLEVVATRFSRVATETVGAWNVDYHPGITYYNSSCIIARTAEAAAMINRNANNKSISVILGVMTYPNKPGGLRKTQTELNVALEAEQIANEIFPGTVEGFQIFINVSVFRDVELAELGLHWVKYMKSATKGKPLKIGIITQVEDYRMFDREYYDENDRVNGDQPRVRLVKNSHFVNFKAIPSNNMSKLGALETFTLITRPLNLLRPMRKLASQKFDLIVTTGWSSSGNYTFQNVKQMESYWVMFNQYASEKKFTIWLNEAFDIPGKTFRDQDLSHYGWWNWDREKLATDPSSYTEKILEYRNRFKNDPEIVSGFPTWIGWGVAAAVVITAVFTGLMVHIYNRITSLKEGLSYEEIKEFKYGFADADLKVANYGPYTCETAIRMPYDQTLEIPKNVLEIYWDQLLGSGQFGSVHKALIKGEPPKEVALKTTKTGCQTMALRGLLSEIKILTHLGHHENIVSICGAYTAELRKGKVYVALELCEMGSLKNHLTTMRQGNSIDESEQYIQEIFLQWSYEIATGMEYIGQKGVIHADLATRNILLTSERRAKIADFGLSRRLYEYDEYVKTGEEPVPFRWMAIESLKSRQFSCQSDVWSFGVTLWEIFSLGMEPYPGYSYNMRFIESLEDGSAKMICPIEATPEIYQIMQDCWKLRPDERPSFGVLKERISKIRNKDYKYEIMFEENDIVQKKFCQSATA